MPQSDEGIDGFSAFVGLVVTLVALEILRWVVQWIWVSIIWLWQAILVPLFIYFTPAVIAIILVIAVYWGSWIASKNYFSSLSANVKSDGLTGKLTRNYIITTLTVTLVSIYLFFAVYSAMLIYTSSEAFVFHVVDHYDSIKYPSFKIRPLFGS